MTHPGSYEASRILKIVIKSHPQKLVLNQSNTASRTDSHTCALQVTTKLPLMTKVKLENLSLINIIDIIQTFVDITKYQQSLVNLISKSVFIDRI